MSWEKVEFPEWATGTPPPLTDPYFEEPDPVVKPLGWLEEQAPAYQWMNWIHSRSYEWLEHLDQHLDVAQSVHIESTGTISWSGLNLTFTSDLLFYFVKDGVLYTNKILAASSPITIDDTDMLVMIFDDSAPVVTLSEVAYGSIDVGKYSITSTLAENTSKREVVVFRRSASTYLYDFLNKQAYPIGETTVLGYQLPTIWPNNFKMAATTNLYWGNCYRTESSNGRLKDYIGNGVATIEGFQQEYDASVPFAEMNELRRLYFASPTSGPSIIFGEPVGGRWGAFGSQFSSGNPYIASNAIHTFNSDQWSQNDAGQKSVLLDVNYATNYLGIYFANAGTGAGTKAAFWGTPVANFSQTAATFGADVIINSGNDLFLDGGGDTWFRENSANNVILMVGGGLRWSCNTTEFALGASVDLSVAAGKAIYYDGGSDTYQTQSSANVLDTYCGGSIASRLNTTSATFYGDLIVRDTSHWVMFHTGHLRNLAFPGSVLGTNAVMYDVVGGYFYYQTSSMKFKDNIRSIDFDTSKLFDLEPVSFEAKQTGETAFGFIAEDAFKKIPQLVGLDREGNPHTFYYNMLSTVMLAEMKKMKAALNNHGITW